MALESSFRVTPSSSAVGLRFPSSNMFHRRDTFQSQFESSANTPLTGGLGAPVRQVYGLHSLQAGLRFFLFLFAFFFAHVGQLF